MKNIQKNNNLYEEQKKIIAALQEQLIQQTQTINNLTKQTKELLSYKEKYQRLLEELHLNKQRLYGSSSEKNPNWPDLFDEPGTVDLSDEVRHQIEDDIEVKGHTRKKHPTRKPLPKELPRESIIYDLSEAEKICTCGACLTKIGEEVTEQLKVIPAELSVVQHIRYKYACRSCKEQIKLAKMPSLLLPKCIATPELVAYTLVAKYCDALPLYRQESIWQRLDVDLPRSSLCGWLMKVAELCIPLIKIMQKNIVAYDYVQADETTVQVLNEVGRDNKTKSFMWCYRGGGEDQLSIIYEYQETRGGYHAEKFLLGFEGYLQSDAYSGYNFIDKKSEIIKVRCMAHARRKFIDVLKISQSNGLATEAIKYIKSLYKIEKEARENNFSPEQRYQLRQEKSPQILSGFKLWLEHNLTKVPEKSKLGEAIRYILSNWEGLNNYLKDGRIEIDNNLIENAIRPFAVGRKNWLFAGSPRGAEASSIFYSLIETCKLHQVEPYRYFCAMLHRIRFCQTEEDYRQLLPYHLGLN